MSRSASPEYPVIVAHALCAPHLRKLVEDAVEAFDRAQLLPPQRGELFESAKDCLRRQDCARDLEAHVNRDGAGNIVSRCKREEIATNARDCTLGDVLVSKIYRKASAFSHLAFPQVLGR
jgi:hypothetical protein